MRIYPALVVTILLTVFVLGPILTNLSLQEYFTNYTTIKYLVNVLAIKIQYFLPGVFENNFYARAVNGSLWTLPLEIACYGLVASIGLLCKKSYVKSIIIGSVVICIFQRALIHENTYYFMIGAIIYLLRDKIILNKYMAIVSFTLFLINIYINTNIISTHLVNGITFSYFLIYISFMRTKYIKNFSKKGDFSYGLYIFAFPIQQIISLKIPSLNPYTHFIVSSLITLIFAYFSWHLIEKQALKLKKHLDTLPEHRIITSFKTRLNKQAV